ncbi:hypothetical protein FHL15_008366 [Xylaria flabelliformis]|uniref:Uncharacterized protein n=1 Tax=Xylaria flabelliformis TaxID=2512241 RepID=A0A553HS63_9PEZI|nr:hypothetical protein FHL15_008366 [Xylaria flabelliformis]
MTTPSLTASPTLPADWVPTSAGCLRTDDYWIWDFDAGNKDARTVIGGPSQTTNCFASTWNPTITYAGSGCPPQYTSACQNGNFNAVTCCPSAYDFTCQPETWTPGNHAEWFRCVSQYASQDVVKVTLTDFSQNTIAVGMRTRHKYEHLVALALMYTTPPSTSLPPTTSLPTSTGTHSPEETTSGLSSGAAAGIGVGAAAAVILVALLAWFLYRRKKTPRPSDDTPHFPTALSSSVPPHSPPTTYMAENSRGVSPYLVQPKASLPPKELPADEGPRFELDGNAVAQQNR